MKKYMVEESRFDIVDDTIEGDQKPDKTGEKNDIQKEIDGLPKEDDLGEDRGKEKEKPDRSEIAQKIKWREKYNESQKRIAELEASLKSPDRTPNNQGADEKELAAQKYIKQQAREAYEELMREEKEKEKRVTREFDDKVEAILDDNSDITEKQLLDIVEEFEVDPAVALRILRKSQDEGIIKKPHLPKPKGGGGGEAKKTVDDSGKSMWQIAQEIGKEYKENKH